MENYRRKTVSGVPEDFREKFCSLTLCVPENPCTAQPFWLTSSLGSKHSFNVISIRTPDGKTKYDQHEKKHVLFKTQLGVLCFRMVHEKDNEYFFNLMESHMTWKNSQEMEDSILNKDELLAMKNAIQQRLLVQNDK